MSLHLLALSFDVHLVSSAYRQSDLRIFTDFSRVYKICSTITSGVHSIVKQKFAVQYVPSTGTEYVNEKF